MRMRTNSFPRSRAQAEFIVDGVAIDVGADESLAIPPHASHEVEALETRGLDIFTPARRTGSAADDAYLRR